MPGLGAKDGELIIDHRASPGTAMVPEGKVFEAATFTCSHCQSIVVKNPERKRERHVCLKCMSMVCDACAPFDCRPFMTQFEPSGQIISTPGMPARQTGNLILPHNG